MSEEQQIKIHYAEGSPWFWKIFGSAIIGVISILLLAHISNINNNIDRAFLDLRGENKDFRLTLDTQKDKVANLEINKEKLQTLEKTILLLQASLDKAMQNIAVNDTQIKTLEKNISDLQQCNKDAAKLLNEVREKIVVTDAVKKATEQPK